MGTEDSQIAPEKEQEMAQEAGYIKRGNVYVVDSGRGNFGEYATVAWSGREEGFSVQVYEKFTYFDHYLDETVADANHIWGSYMLEGKAYENDRSDYGATADGRITTVEGLRKALSQFAIPWPKGLSDELSAEINRDELAIARDSVRTVDLEDQLKNALVKIVYNDMSAVDAEERRIGTTDLARETLSRTDLVGEADPNIKTMVQALRDIADAGHGKEPHVIAGDALAEVGRMRTPATKVETSEFNPPYDDRFPTWNAYDAALARMETEGIARAEREMAGAKAAVYSALEDIRAVGTGRHDEQVWAETVGRARQTLAEHEKNLGGSMENTVMRLALRVIADSNELITYAQSDPRRVSAGAVDRGVNAFKAGIEFLMKLDEQKMSVYGESVDNLAKVVYQAGHYGGSSYAQLGARMSAIAGAAIDEVNSMSHSVGQGVSPEPQKANEVGQGKRGIGIAL